MEASVNMQECVEHFVEGRNAWKLGLLGFFLRVRGFVAAAILTIITMGVPFWVPNKFPKLINVDFKYLIIYIIFLFIVIYLLGFYYLRYRSKRSLDIKSMLHEFTHYLRDHQTQVFYGMITYRSLEHEADFFQGYIDQICSKTQSYFKRLTGDSSIAVAIRLAVEEPNGEEDNKILYKTIGRSSGLSSKRKDTSTDIPSNVGIPRFFADKNSMGVLIYSDIKKAAGINAYILTENDRIYNDEIITMMVAPLNAWDGKTQNMIGLLYITSREENTFSVKYIDTLRFVSDMIAQSIGFTVLNMETQIR
jgi:hypothetical protein